MQLVHYVLYSRYDMHLFTIADVSYDGFCVRGRLLPSVFVIGVAKCGTTTFDNIVQQLPELSHGARKEHWFHGLTSKKLTKFNRRLVDFYARQFPKCSERDQKSQKHYVMKTYDATNGFAFPSAKSAENIKRFYKYLGIPSRKLLFTSMLCPNTRRIPSCFYYSLKYMVRRADKLHRHIDVRLTKLNVWLQLVLQYPNAPYWNQGGPLRKNCLMSGYYDDIFRKYLNIFPESRFFFIDSYYAFDNQQKLADSLSRELKVPIRNITFHHSNKGKHKDELTTKLKTKVKSFYEKREQKFKDMIKDKHNVQTFPEQLFGKDW